MRWCCTTPVPHSILDFSRDRVSASTPFQNLTDSKERRHRIKLKLYDQAQMVLFRIRQQEVIGTRMDSGDGAGLNVKMLQCMAT